ncbi:chloramphenicol phosphotransferase CPT family protein [Sphingosinicellaceae bacterium]|nr:chloramphenicol phosphotransferase CPT family protein [Sphingosinicellaceae bacterium]
MSSQLGKVILLNGTSSAGKTSVAIALQRQLVDHYVLLGIDQFLSALPPDLHGSARGVYFIDHQDGVRLRLGPAGVKLERAFHRAVRAVADAGLNVIVDDVLFEPWLLEDWHIVLAGIHLTLVGVHCPITEAERREVARGDRRVGQARGQHGVVHLNCVYDLEVDAIACDPEQAASEIRRALAASSAANSPPQTQA